MEKPARHPPWFDPAMPAREDCVVRDLLERNARDDPDGVLALFEDGTRWTHGEAASLAHLGARALAELGVKPGDMVSVWLPNGPAALRVWFSIACLGAVFAPINTAFRGRLLEHVLARTGASLLICHVDLLDRLEAVATGPVEKLIVVGGVPATPPRLDWLPESRLDEGGPPLADQVPLEPWDISAVIYTSGTTGPSKGVPQTYLQSWTTASCSYGYLRSDDRMVVNLPLFHVGGTSSIHAVLAKRASLALYQGFDTARFWDQIRETGATTTSGLIGSMADFLLKAEPKPDDPDNPLRIVTLGPVNATTVALARRFGFHWLTGFNMTEVSVPLLSPLDSTIPFCCGRPRTGIEARIVDEHDIEVPPGRVGELILRADLPWTMSPGYLGDAEATARAWRNGWFHTGDAFRRDEDGNFFFVDRLKDTVRRRGENISSVEVEAEVTAFPGVGEAAVVAVASEQAEDEILVCVAPRPGHVVEPRALVEFLRGRMAHFMVPRYIRLVAELPKTPTNKVRKAELRALGVTPDTFDREAAGIVIKRERFSR